MTIDIIRRLRRGAVYAFAVIGAGFTAFCLLAAVFGERAVPVAMAQISDQFLSRRIDQVEQRFYSIESRINRVEQQQLSRPSSPPPVFNTNETEIASLR